MSIGRLLEPLRAWQPVPSCRHANGASSTPRSIAPPSAAIHPFYTASVREFEAAGRPVVGSAPVGVEGTAAWLGAIGETCGVSRAKVDAALNGILPAIRGAHSPPPPITARITLSGYEGSELIVRPPARRSRRRSALCRHRLPEDAVGNEAMPNGCARVASMSSSARRSRRISPQVDGFEPDLAIGTPTPVVQHAKQKAIPSLYFTNLISARPLMGPAGRRLACDGHQRGRRRQGPGSIR